MYSVAIANELIRDIRPVDSKSVLVLNQMEFRVRYLLINRLTALEQFINSICVSLIISASSSLCHRSINVII